MQRLFSTVLGLPVLDEEGDTLGTVSGTLVDPDRGSVLGFFVTPAELFNIRQYYLSCDDILRVSTAVRVRDADRLAEPEDVVRIQPLLADPRTVLGQPVVTQERRERLGTCADIAFDTDTFHVTWIYPRWFFLKRLPVSRDDIVEVTPAAVVVREQLKPVKQAVLQEEPSVPAVSELSAPPAG